MIAGVILVLAVSFYRLLPVMLGWSFPQPDWYINFSPITALCFCSAAIMPRRLAFLLPFAALIGTDFILTGYYGTHSMMNAEFIAKTLATVMIAAFGWQLRANPRLRVLLPGVIAGSVFFYLVTNTVSWLFEPGYLKNFTGWAQALTTGLPKFQPTWMFLRNSLLSDVTFTLLFVLCTRVATRMERKEEETAAAAW